MINYLRHKPFSQPRHARPVTLSLSKGTLSLSKGTLSLSKGTLSLSKGAFVSVLRRARLVRLSMTETWRVSPNLRRPSCHPTEGLPVTLSLSKGTLSLSKGICLSKHISYLLKSIFYLLLCCTTALAQPAPLSRGEWIKIAVSRTGVYQLDKAFFEKHAPDFANADPGKIRVYGGHPTALPQLNSADRVSGLQEIPVSVQDHNQRWDSDDFIAFFARDPHTVSDHGGRFFHQLNPYSNVNYYFITVSDSPSLRVSTVAPTVNLPVREALPFYAYEEKELKNLLNSGRLWLGEMFRSSYTFSPVSEDFVSDYRLDFELYPMGISRQFVETTAGTLSRRDTLTGAPNHPNDNQARYYRISNAHPFSMVPETPPPTVQLQLSAESVGNVGVYFNHWSVTYNRRIRYYPGRQLLFRTLPETAAYACRLTEAPARIWQVNDTGEVKELTRSIDGIFSPENVRGEVLVFDPTALPLPEFRGRVPAQNLQNGVVPELLVVFPEKFRKSAEELIRYKKENEDLEIIGVSLTEIYHQFSSGKTDPTAIRDYCRYLYTSAPGKFRYLLLLGDASFDYKNNNQADYVDIDVLLPTYQSRESLEPIYSFASDDYFAFLDPAEGEWPEGRSVNNQWVSTPTKDHLMDIAVGRIPARNLPELNNYISKYKTYRRGFAGADQNNRLAFVADNRDYNLHQRDAEALEALALQSFPGFLTDKLYLDDFPVTDGTVPQATDKLHDLVNQGTYLITYIGHGAEDGLANEKLLTLNDIFTFSNAGRLPIWFTATCQFGKFDNPGITSGAELLLLRPQTGAIALLTTTRPVYSSTNQAVNQAFFSNFREAKTLGELFRITKNQSIIGEINRNFSLLGDPSLPLPNRAATPALILEPDTLTAYRKVRITGKTEDIQYGSTVITLIDKPGTRQTLGGFPDSPVFDYTLNSEVLLTARFPIENYTYEGEFLVPAGASPGTGQGRLVIHSLSADSALHEFSGLNYPLTSGPPPVQHERVAPELTAIFTPEGLLTWKLTDPSGISAKTLSLEINGEAIHYPLRYYNPLQGGTAGELSYYTSHLPDGIHQSTLIASDVYNNTARKTFEFQIEKPALKVLELTAYPNPVTDYLRLKVRHNRAGDYLIATLLVSDLMGKEWYKEEFNCSRCDEEIWWETDFNRRVPPFTKVYFRLTLQSKNHSGQAGGTLFFSK